MCLKTVISLSNNMHFIFNLHNVHCFVVVFCKANLHTVLFACTFTEKICFHHFHRKSHAVWNSINLSFCSHAITHKCRNTTCHLTPNSQYNTVAWSTDCYRQLPAVHDSKRQYLLRVFSDKSVGPDWLWVWSVLRLSVNGTILL